MTEFEKITNAEFHDKLNRNGLTLYCLAYFLGDKLRDEAPNLLHTREAFLQKIYSHQNSDYIDDPYFILIDEVSETINDYVDERIAESIKLEEHFLTVYVVNFRSPNEYYHFYRPMNNTLSYEAYLEYNRRLRQECELRGKKIKWIDFDAVKYVGYCHLFKGGNVPVFEENTNHTLAWMHLSHDAEKNG